MKEFQQEFIEYWNKLTNKGLFFGLLTAWLAVFHFLGNSTFGYIDTASLFTWLSDIYNSPQTEDGHGNLIPIAVLVLFWWKRKELIEIRQQPWAPALGILALGSVMHVVGYVIQQPRLSLIGMLTGAYALIGLAWGWRWMRASFFPFVLFVFCIPISNLVESLTFPLRMMATSITYWVTKGILGLSVVRQGTQLFDPNGAYNYDVAAACSGIRSLISLLALTTIYGMVTFRSNWKRFAMIAIAVPLAVACNVLRLLGIVIAAEAFGQKAGDFVHEWSGFLTYAVAIGFVLLLGHFWREELQERKNLEVQTA